MTLGGALAGRNNGLNFVRLMLAALVIVSHVWPLGGFGEAPSFDDVGMGSGAVAGFFAISGYLICSSRARLSVRAFAVARALRIFPAYWLALVSVALVFAPLAAVLTNTRVEVRGAAWYVISNLSTLTVTPTFGDAIPRAAWQHTDWNGSVWTLQYELLCYVLIGVAFCVRRVRAEPGLFAVALFATLTTLNCMLTAAGMHGRDWSMQADFARMGAYFAAGAVLWAFRDRVRLDARLATLAALALTALLVWGHADDVGALPLAYLALWAGALVPVRWGRRTDLSYGLYVFGFPVQMVLSIATGKALGLVGFGVASLLVAGLAAVLSWRFVELPTLRLRGRLDGSKPVSEPAGGVAATVAPLSTSAA